MPRSVFRAASHFTPSKGSEEEVEAPSQRPRFPLTGALQAELDPPPNPYRPPQPAKSATLVGAAGQYAVPQGAEIRVGRDPAQCPIHLTEPRVSGVHAVLRFDGQLWVRDEASNNGTYVDGARVPSRVWTPVPPTSQLRFGPVEFQVRLEQA